MTTRDFRAAVDEVRNNGGNRQTMYIKETWKDREMTIFTYSDGTAQVFESTRPFLSCNSEVEAVAVISKMQYDYDKKVEEDRARWRSNNVKVESCSLLDYYGKPNRYYGD